MRSCQIRGVRWIALGAIATVAIAAGGCGSGTQEPPATGVTETGAETTQPRPPLSRGEYQELLAAELEKLRTSIFRIDDARSYDGLRRRTEQAQRTAENATERLEAVTPPEDAAVGHEALVEGLRTLTGNLGKTVDAIEARSICAAPSLTARLSQLRAADELRAARRALKAEGYELPALLPSPRPMPDRRLATGTVFVREIGSGPGELTIENGLVVDGVVALVPTGRKKPALSFYVRGHDSHTVTGIGDGKYRVYFTAGRDWDEELGRFTRKCDFKVFDDLLTFETDYEQGGYQYSVWELSLNPVLGGTASTSPVSPGSFPSVG